MATQASRVRWALTSRLTKINRTMNETENTKLELELVRRSAKSLGKIGQIWRRRGTRTQILAPRPSVKSVWRILHAFFQLKQLFVSTFSANACLARNFVPQAATASSLQPVGTWSYTNSRHQSPELGIWNRRNPETSWQTETPSAVCHIVPKLFWICKKLWKYISRGKKGAEKEEQSLEPGKMNFGRETGR